jgi:ABC-2 type transport system ATP-binding protein
MSEMIKVNNLKKRFGDKAAVDGLSFSVEQGTIFGLLGRNGAGKTTTIRMIMDVFRADSGDIFINKVPSTRNKLRIGYLPEERGLYPKRKILEQMEYLGKLRGLTTGDARRQAMEKLLMLGAEEYADRTLDTLSKGNQQKIQLAISLVGDPKILILDEPFSGLDPVNAAVLKLIVKQQADNGVTVLFSSHQMSQVEEFCKDICIINDGKEVLSGDLAEIKRAYPRDKIYLVPEPASRARFEARFNFPSVKKRQDGFEIELASEDRKGELLHSLQGDNIKFDRFEVIEPTLEEIFVEKVGRESQVKSSERTGDAGGYATLKKPEGTEKDEVLGNNQARQRSGKTPNYGIPPRFRKSQDATEIARVDAAADSIQSDKTDDANQTDANQADAIQADANQTDTIQADANQTDTIQTGAIQTGAIQTDTIQTDTNQTDTNQTDTNVTENGGKK